MSVWICIPSIRPGGGTIPEWKRAGYRVAIVRQRSSVPEADIEIPTDRYLGWSASINMAVRAAMEADPQAQWFVGGGDDTLPDASNHPEFIARQCYEYFKGNFGVMQPIGDLKLWPNSAIDKFAGSPWMGRAFCKRIYGGKGPMWEEFGHMFADEHCKCVAEKLGVYWMRSDLIHKHMHALRSAGGKIPDFLKPVNTKEHWEHSKAIFQRLEAGGFAEADNLLTEANREEEILKAC